MYLEFIEGMKWVPSPQPSSLEPGNITGAYISPDENIEWFCINDPGKRGAIRVVGYAIRKRRKRQSLEAPYLVRVK